jgi:hypothetical protein
VESASAVGAALVKKEYDAMVDREDKKVIISTCCHTVNLLVQKHYPGALPCLAAVLSPHAGPLHGYQAPPPRRKDGFYRPLHIQKSGGKTGGDEGLTRLFPIAGGILRSMEKNNPAYAYMAVDGMEKCIKTLENLPICRVRQIAYSTFTIIRIADCQEAEIIQYDNPHVIFLRSIFWQAPRRFPWVCQR